MSLWVSGVSSTLDSAINSSVASGVTHVVAAGNRNLDACSFSPSSASSAFVIAATGSDDAKASYSNFGTCVDLFAPGSNITSLGHSSDTAIRGMSGTSMSSPMVAGAAALYLQSNPTASPATVKNRILADSTSGVVSGLDTVTPNKLLYTWLGDSQPPIPGSVTIIKQVFTIDGGTASIGLVLNDGGGALSFSRLTLLNLSTGEEWPAMTNSFGYFVFENIPVSANYAVSVNESKRHVFAPATRTFSLEGDISGLDFVASPRTK